MDPKACLKRFLDACIDGDHDEAQDALSDLQEWLRKGGSLPEVKPLDLPGKVSTTCYELPWTPVR